MSGKKRYGSTYLLLCQQCQHCFYSKLDLLIRVRYSNPLPAPPCPPKLLDIPTNPMRYARPEFLNDLANDTSLPMIVDAECGMPLDLGKWGCLWEEEGENLGEYPSKDILFIGSGCGGLLNVLSMLSILTVTLCLCRFES